MNYEYIYGMPEDKVLIRIQRLHQHVFEGSELSLEKLRKKPKLLFCFALHNDEVVGFKIGYELSSDKFYSWLGGVHDSCRKQGIASELMNLQHGLIKESHYKTVQTKSRNNRRDMLILNLKHGFDVIETYVDEKGRHKIILEKSL